MDNNLIILDNKTIPNIPNPGGVQEIVIIDTKPPVISECDNTNITIVDNTPNNQITVSTQEVVVEINNSHELIFKELPCSPTEVFNSPEQELKHIYWGNITGNINLQKDLALALSSIKNSISFGIDEFYTILNNRINTLVSETNTRLLSIEQSIDNIEQSGTTKNITATGVTVGGISEGDLIPKGTTLTDILEKMLIKRIAATYTEPTLVLTKNISSVELGETVNTIVYSTFTKNSSGGISSFKLLQDSTEVLTTIGTYIENIIYSSSITFTATIITLQGDILLDNLGSESPYGGGSTGLPSRTLTRTTTVVAYQPVYYWIGTSIPTDWSTATRVLNFTSREITVTAGVGQYIYFLFPNSFTNIDFSVGGFSGGFTSINSSYIYNRYNVNIISTIYRSDNPNLGETTINITV